MPRLADPTMRTQLVEAAALRLAEHGRDGLSVRSLAGDVGASTQVVYTHFGGLDDLLAEVWREGFRRFAVALDAPEITDDPVADWIEQGWRYRHFALTNQALYQVMFGEGLRQVHDWSPEDGAAAAATFVQLLVRIERCRDAGRWVVDDVWTAGDVIWGMVHGLVLIELPGYYDFLSRSPLATYEQSQRVLAVGMGDDPARVEASIATGRERAEAARLL
ncbi:MAG: TetR/AcrR family transcriptional regulator [Acidimicrobiales bacterium]